jgi:hypothetical protein
MFTLFVLKKYFKFKLLLGEAAKTHKDTGQLSCHVGDDRANTQTSPEPK